MAEPISPELEQLVEQYGELTHQLDVIQTEITDIPEYVPAECQNIEYERLHALKSELDEQFREVCQGISDIGGIEFLMLNPRILEIVNQNIEYRAEVAQARKLREEYRKQISPLLNDLKGVIGVLSETLDSITDLPAPQEYAVCVEAFDGIFPISIPDKGEVIVHPHSVGLRYEGFIVEAMVAIRQFEFMGKFDSSDVTMAALEGQQRYLAQQVMETLYAHNLKEGNEVETGRYLVARSCYNHNAIRIGMLDRMKLGRRFGIEGLRASPLVLPGFDSKHSQEFFGADRLAVRLYKSLKPHGMQDTQYLQKIPQTFAGMTMEHFLGEQ